jgi:hypothetical protein
MQYQLYYDCQCLVRCARGPAPVPRRCRSSRTGEREVQRYTTGPETHESRPGCFLLRDGLVGRDRPLTLKDCFSPPLLHKQNMALCHDRFSIVSPESFRSLRRCQYERRSGTAQSRSAPLRLAKKPPGDPGDPGQELLRPERASAIYGPGLVAWGCPSGHFVCMYGWTTICHVYSYVRHLYLFLFLYLYNPSLT